MDGYASEKHEECWLHLILHWVRKRYHPRRFNWNFNVVWPRMKFTKSIGGKTHCKSDDCMGFDLKRDKNNHNQSPAGIIWSSIPSPCYFDVVKSQRVAGQRSREESCRMGRNSVWPFGGVRESAGRFWGLAGGVWDPARGVWEPAGGVWGPPSRVWGPVKGVWTNRQMNGKMEFLPILQDHVPSQGRCPKTTAFKQFQSMHCQKPCYSILQIINLENILYFTFSIVCLWN